ncbi:MAG: TetR/AcrR family transcriptional regulator, partial [Actinobacteria bacterium]|nr:TetR/AcrR family transcriptional regulator [Actinomycetota bacterium]
MVNVSKEETRRRMICAVSELMDQGISISEISGLTVTEYCGVDKMYVNRYFEDLSGLFLETIWV